MPDFQLNTSFDRNSDEGSPFRRIDYFIVALVGTFGFLATGLWLYSLFYAVDSRREITELSTVFGAIAGGAFAFILGFYTSRER